MFDGFCELNIEWRVEAIQRPLGVSIEDITNGKFYIYGVFHQYWKANFEIMHLLLNMFIHG